MKRGCSNTFACTGVNSIPQCYTKVYSIPFASVYGTEGVMRKYHYFSERCFSCLLS